MLQTDVRVGMCVHSALLQCASLAQLQLAVQWLNGDGPGCSMRMLWLMTKYLQCTCLCVSDRAECREWRRVAYVCCAYFCCCLFIEYLSLCVCVCVQSGVVARQWLVVASACLVAMTICISYPQTAGDERKPTAIYTHTRANTHKRQSTAEATTIATYLKLSKQK